MLLNIVCVNWILWNLGSKCKQFPKLLPIINTTSFLPKCGNSCVTYFKCQRQIFGLNVERSRLFSKSVYEHPFNTEGQQKHFNLDSVESDTDLLCWWRNRDIQLYISKGVDSFLILALALWTSIELQCAWGALGGEKTEGSRHPPRAHFRPDSTPTAPPPPPPLPDPSFPFNL